MIINDIGLIGNFRKNSMFTKKKKVNNIIINNGIGIMQITKLEKFIT